MNPWECLRRHRNGLDITESWFLSLNILYCNNKITNGFNKHLLTDIVLAMEHYTCADYKK